MTDVTVGMYVDFSHTSCVAKLTWLIAIIGWIQMKFFTHIYGPQRVYRNDFDDNMNFSFGASLETSRSN